MDEVKVIEIKKSIFAENDKDADSLRKELKDRGVYLLNLMSSPGSGKTTTLIKTINLLKDKLRIAVMEADIDSDVDAVKIKDATESLHRYVQHGHMTIGRNRRDFIELDKSDIVVESYDNSSRQDPGVTSAKDPFREYHTTLTEEQVRRETARCLSCGASVVDENKCIGCGVCTTKCGFDAIHLHRVHPEASHLVTSEDKFSGILPYMLKRTGRIIFNKK